MYHIFDGPVKRDICNKPLASVIIWSMRPKTIAILLMAGSGKRFASALPKQFHRLCGKKIYLHTLETLLASQLFSEIILVAHKDRFEEITNDIAIYEQIPIHCIEGGRTRQESSYLATLYSKDLDPDLLLIHDAVRPFVSPHILKENIEVAARFGAADTCIPSADTLVYAPGGDTISTIPLRSELFRGQTPQTFQFPLILEAHQTSNHQDATDDCSLLLELGKEVKVVLGSERNIKITTDLDLLLAEQLFRHSSPSVQINSSALAGKKIAVTGGSGGIGREICALLEREGALPLVLSLSSDSYPVDLTSARETEEVFQKIQEKHGPLDALINSVGLLKRGSLEELSSLEIEEQISSNLLPIVYSCKYASLKKGGHILNIASSSYLKGQKDAAIYSCTKAAVVNFSQALAEERCDLHINTLAPQRTNTTLRTENFPGEAIETLLDPEQIASQVVAVLKTSLTGSVIPVRWQEEPISCLSSAAIGSHNS